MLDCYRDHVTTDPAPALQGYSGRAVGAICVAVAAVALSAAQPLVGLLVGTLTIALAVGCRRELRRRPELRGWGLSLTAMIIGCTVVALTGLATAAPALLSALFLALA